MKQSIFSMFILISAIVANAESMTCDVATSYYNETNIKTFFQTTDDFSLVPGSVDAYQATLTFSEVSPGVDVHVIGYNRPEKQLDLRVVDRQTNSNAYTYVVQDKANISLRFADRGEGEHRQNTADVYCRIF